MAAAPSAEETLNSLQRLLRRAHVVVEELQERIVTNRMMLRQLNRLQKEMYRGYHTLDTLRCRRALEDDHRQAASPSFTASRFNPAKRPHLWRGGSSSKLERATEVLGGLEIAIRDVSELAVFLSGCPRRCRQPYSMYLLLDKCMFSRQMETEQVMEFLFQAEDSGAGTPAVLPIIGRGRIGKTTIIEHACNDGRVRAHFSQILRFSQDSIRDVKTIASLSDCGVIKHHHHDRAVVVGGGRTLVIIELTGDIDDDVWAKLYSDCRHQVASGSKIIVASRSDKIARLGTAESLRVQPFTEEAYWYFFKVRTFGSSADIEDHPKVASIAMDLAREMNGCFFGASVFSRLLKGSFDVHLWSMALASVREFKRMNLLLFGADFVDLWQVVDPVFVRRANNTYSSEYLVILDDYQTGLSVHQDSAQSEGPQMSTRDLFFGTDARPRGRFRVLAWRSHIPPHYSYMMNCEVRRLQRRRKKRAQHAAS
ncbi:hypothetical protein BAE44_0007609 [Dichanthelium oligosanthes]|uniref:NB-ARC domain-containing protein n=1 Tax=Dichanthelium oligosanthes TaxID=888268 RepID=A0A1E5W1X7_9POAL|nr:hypothetical protein BAE44_0007609 [Dichanthelium oligosanthes]